MTDSDQAPSHGHLIRGNADSPSEVAVGTAAENDRLDAARKDHFSHVNRQ